MKKECLSIEVIGKIASDYLHNEKIIKFLNLTSQGAFIECGEEHILFVNFEEFHGPLTANLNGLKNSLHDIPKGDTAVFDQGRLTFNRSHIQINASNAKIWNPPLIDEIDLINKEIRKSQTQILAQKISENRKTEGYSALVKRIFEPTEYNKNFIHQNSSNLPDVIKIRDFLLNQDYEKLGQYLENFLGMGIGLTPSGDDFILGIILSINRWKTILNIHPSYKILNQRLIIRALQRTNMISAELIRCATLGQADERLIQAVDYLAGANINMEAVLDGLLNWGNSSGIDAFAGMATAFSTTT